MFIQTEATPNPATLKFLPGRDVLVGEPRDFRTAESAVMRSPAMIWVARAAGKILVMKTTCATGRSRSDTLATCAVTSSPFITRRLSSADSPMSDSTWSAGGSASAGFDSRGRLRASPTARTAIRRAS